MLTLTDNDFQRLYKYIQKNYGIDLSKKKQLIEHSRNHLGVPPGSDLIHIGGKITITLGG